MDKDRFLIAALIVLGLALPQANIFAEVVEGKIASLNPDTNYMTVVRSSPSTGQAEELKILVPDGTAFKGAKTLQDLKAGDAVEIKASPDKDAGVLKATSIEVQNQG